MRTEPGGVRVGDEPQRPSERSSQRRAGMQDGWRYVSLGLQLTFTVLLFVALGWWLDRRLGSSPWAVAGCGILGISAALYHFVKDALK